MSEAIPFGKKEVVGGRLRVYYYGYWIKAYEVPADTLLAKKRLIEALTRRLFNHTEHGINIPGHRLEESRRMFDAERDPERRRVKGAMLAGCLFNRATDIFTKLVEMQAVGVSIGPESPFMQECGDYLREALDLGKLVLHRSGEEGLDELWGEPFKAFAFPIEEFYNSRYIKIAQSMQAIDGIRDELLGTLSGRPSFEGIAARVVDFTEAAKVKCETLRTDPEIFDVWTSFVVSAERLAAFQPPISENVVMAEAAARGVALALEAKNVVSYITRARVPMPKTTRELLDRLRAYQAECPSPPARSVA